MEPLSLHLSYYVSKKCDPNWCIPEAVIPFYDITFITEGSVSYCVNQKQYNLTAGDVIFIPQGSKRSAGTTGMSCMVFIFTLEKNASFLIETKQNIREDSKIFRLLKDFNRTYFSDRKSNKFSCYGIFCMILDRLINLKNINTKNHRMSVPVAILPITSVRKLRWMRLLPIPVCILFI